MNMPPRRPALIVFSKIRLENIPLPPDRESHSLVRVKFRVSEGIAAAETPLRLPNPDGSVEWTEPIELRVDDSQVLLIAVISQRQRGSWHMVNGGRFKGPTVNFMKSGVWQSPSAGPFSPSFYAKADVHMDDVPQGDVGFPPSAPAVPLSDQVGVDASSGSHYPFSMSRGTSLSSSGYESARDWLPETAASGGRAPSGMQRAQSEETNIETLSAQPSAIPTVAAVPVDPLGIRSSPIIPHASAVRAERGSWTAGYPEPPQGPPMRRTRSGGYVRQGSGRGYVREGSGRSRRPSFGSRRSSSHSDDSLIREESTAESVDINSLPSPVGTYREPRLLDEGVPLAEDIEEADEALESSGDLTRSWGGPALAGVDRMTEEISSEIRPPPFAPEVDSSPDVPQSSIGGVAAYSVGWKERPQSEFFTFFKGKRKTRKGHLTAAAIGPQFRSEYTAESSGRLERAGLGEKTTDRSRLTRRRLSAESIGEDMKSTEPTADLERPERVLHRMPLQETKARDEPGALSPVGEADTGVVGSDGGESDSVAAEAVAESQRVDSTVIRAGATGEEVKRADSTIATAEMETKAGAGTSPESPSWLEVDGLKHKLTEQVCEHLSPARRKPPLPARPWNILDSKAFISPPASLPKMDLGMKAESPSRPAPSAPPLSPTTPRLTPADALSHPHPEVGSCSPVSHDEEEKEDDLAENLAKALSMLPFEAPREALHARLARPERPRRAPFSYEQEDSSKHFPISRLRARPAKRRFDFSRVTGEDLISYVSGHVLLESEYTKNLFSGVMQRNSSIQSNAPNPDRAVGKEPVIFDCFAPRTVVRGMSFDLVVFAYLRRQREEVLKDAQKRGAAEAGFPETIPIMREKRVTVVLDLPDNTFSVTQSYHHYNTLPHVREFIWTGEKAEANFNVECKPDAELGGIACGAKIIEGDTMTRLSFRLEVVQTGSDGRSLQQLDATVVSIEPSVNMIDPRELTLLNIIGSGAQGETYKGRWGNKHVAVKCLKHCPPSNDLHREAAILSLLGHFPHTVEFYGICRQGRGSNQKEDSVKIVTKFEEGGSIHDALGIVGCKGSGSSNGRNGHRSRLSTAELNPGVRLRWARQLATALADVHSKSVLHNDVACRNALLSRPGAVGDAVLCDFGLSSLLWGNGLATVKMLQEDDEYWPLNQMPKEALDVRHLLSPASDTWMFGTTLYEMFEEKTPFAGIDPNEAKRLILEGKTLETPEMLKREGSELVKLYKECLHQDHSRRPQMEDIVGRLDACLLRKRHQLSPMVY